MQYVVSSLHRLSLIPRLSIKVAVYGIPCATNLQLRVIIIIFIAYLAVVVTYLIQHLNPQCKQHKISILIAFQ